MTTTLDAVARLRETIGVKRGPTAWRTVTQADIDAFAQVSGDHYWIHTDVERARRESPFGTTIAHGNLTPAAFHRRYPRGPASARGGASASSPSSRSV